METDRRRVLQHLASVAADLAASPTEHLDDAMRRGRGEMLAELDRYRATAELPRNTYGAGRSPVFVDEAGRRCAVAHLIAASGDDVLLQRTRASSNLARIHEMTDPALVRWADRHGLTVGELARIQPAYRVVDPGATAVILAFVAASAGSLGAALAWLARFGRDRARAAAATAVGVLLFAAAVLLWNWKAQGCSHVGLGSCMTPWTGAHRAVVALGVMVAVVAIAWFRRAPR